MILEKFIKQPSEYKDYDVDFAPWLAHDKEDSLDDVSVRVDCLTDAEDDSLTVPTVQITETTAKLWVAGGTAGRKYKLTIIATTTVGRIDESELIFTVKDY